MKNIDEIWKKRVVEYNTELRKYLRYMFNDHLLFVLIFALGGGAFTYNQWVATLDGSFPAPLIMAVILGLILTWSPVYTFLREADAVFLLPLESRMKSFFQKGIWTSFISQSYILLLVLAAMMPMYVKVTGQGFQSFFLLLALLLGLKVWNLYVRWYTLKNQEREAHLVDYVIRFALNAVFLYMVLSDASMVLAAVVAIILLGYLFYFKLSVKEKSLKWDVLISLEEQRMLLFYRMANMFTDVPKLKGKVHRRRWLDGLLNTIKYQQKQTFTFLYARSLLRTSEYFGLYIRLSLISMVILFFSDTLWLGIAIGLLFMYLTGFQLIPMYKRFDYKIWVSLYPAAQGIKMQSFQKVVLWSMIVQAILFSMALLVSGQWAGAALMLAAGLLFAFVFSFSYLIQRLKKFDY
ncbi:ABC transporter permease [Rossellomorea vietnamensis]|uniref:ABC transporter permease n=2 Tax=Rossellomorea TaxID=2837508 RepID=A0A5D4KDC7_9BACI|nr:MULTISPECIES: ABC transporter permease [Rossellomorea]TYR74899.1 ABC transporter permease [Rossellomorea vietnamensis]TYS83281.1 ABC transporter permease [Rossellomorea aquimaris]